jgi:small GTP-binding protein
MIKRTKFNVSLLGDATVGKTCLVNSLKGLGFDENQIATIGVDDVIDEAKFDNKIYKFKIFDTAGQERYTSISTNTIQLADGFFLVFAVDNKNSFERITFWMQNIEEKVQINHKVIIIIGNKIDVQGDKRVVSNEEALQFAKKYKLKYLETSAKTGFRVKEAFKTLYEDIYELNKKLDNDDNIKLSEEDNKNNNKLKGKKKSIC